MRSFCKPFWPAFASVIALQLVSACGEPVDPDWSEVEAKVYCGKLLREQLLSDPDSYRFDSVEILSKDGPSGDARINYRAKNAFGGYVRSSAYCSASYKNGELTYRVNIE